MNRFLMLLAALPAAAGCAGDYTREIDLLNRRCFDLHTRLQVAEDSAKDSKDRLERLQSLYHDLSVRHKDLQFEVKLLRTRVQPFSAAEDEKKAEERMMELVKRIGTESDQDWKGSVRELVALGHMAVPFLLEVYRTEGIVAITRAAEVLRSIRDPRSLAPLIVGLDHPSTRGVSAEALGKLGVKSAVKDLARHLKDEDPEIRLRVAEAMGELGDLSGVPVLIARLSHDNDSRRILAFTSLQRLTGKSFDYDPYGAPIERQRAVDLWKKWWNESKGKMELAADIGFGESGGQPDDKPADGSGSPGGGEGGK